jgi:hypothetical protein
VILTDDVIETRQAVDVELSESAVMVAEIVIDAPSTPGIYIDVIIRNFVCWHYCIIYR